MRARGVVPTVRTAVAAAPIFASLFSQTIYGPSSLILLPCLVLLLWIMLINRTQLAFTSWHLALLAFWLIFLISTSVSGVVEVQSDTFSFLVSALFIIAVTAVKYTRAELRFLWRAYVLAGSMAAVSVIYNVLVDHQAFWHRYSTSFFGVDRDPNYASAFIVGAVPLAAFWLIYEARNGIVSVSVLSLLMVGAAATGSRSSLIWLAVQVVLMLVLGLSPTNPNRRSFIRRIAALGGVTMGAVVAVSVYLPDSLVERVTSADSLFTDDGRLAAWSLGIGAFRESPVIGMGLNGGNVLISRQVGIHSHNVYIDILVGSGVLGTVCFVYLMWALVSQKKGDRMILFTLALGMLGPLLFINGFNTLSFWVPLMMIGVTSAYSRSSPDLLSDVVGPTGKSPLTERGASLRVGAMGS